MNIQELSTDILVVGGGMAGVMAAVAARTPDNGVILLDPSNVLGGQATAGGVAGFCGDTQRVNDCFQRLVDELAAYDLIAPYSPLHDRRAFDLEWMAYFLQDMLLRRGVNVLLHSRAVDVRAADGRVAAVLADVGGDLRLIRAGFVIDASGCGVAAKAGFPTEHPGAFRQLPASLYFTLWNTGKPVRAVLPPDCPQWQDDEQLPMTSLHEFASGKLEVKMKVVGFDVADGVGLSNAELFARRQMAGLIHYLQTRGYRGRKYEAFALASVSRHLGIREQVRIVGEHVLSEQEVTHACTFDDAVAVGTYHLDFHWPDKMERAGTGITTMVEPYHIPLRAMIPKGAVNVLVPGRGASGDQMAMSSFRVMATCAQMGYAAGLAAQMSLQAGCSVGDIDIRQLQRRLQSDGQCLDLSHYGQYLRQRRLTREHIFGDERPFAQCHVSTLAQLSNGRFICAFFGGTKEGHSDVGIWTSIRSRCAWSPPTRVAKISDEPHWNPVLFRDPGGRLHLYFRVGSHPKTWRCLEMLSDDGETWSSPRELPMTDGIAAGPVKNKPITLADGTWLAPNSVEIDGIWDVIIDRSENGGATWLAGRRIPLTDKHPADGGVIQPTLWESRPGCVHMLMRSTMGRIYRSDSGDGGRTWTPAYPTELPNNNSGIDVARLDDGSLILACNPVAEHGLRTPLVLMLSHDNGLTWPRRLTLESDAGAFAYPSIIPTSVGAAVCYTWNRQRIAFWHGSVEQITE